MNTNILLSWLSSREGDLLFDECLALYCDQVQVATDHFVIRITSSDSSIYIYLIALSIIVTLSRFP